MQCFVHGATYAWSTLGLPSASQLQRSAGITTAMTDTHFDHGPAGSLCLPSEIPCVVKCIIAQHQGYKDAWNDNVTQA